MGVLLVPCLVGLAVIIVGTATPFLIPNTAKTHRVRQLLIVNIPLTIVCFYLLWLMAYLSQMHLFQMPELVAVGDHH
jgi:hypothetical protein